MTSTDLAQRIGRRPRSMPRLLGKLVTLGLVERTEGGWVALRPTVEASDDLDRCTVIDFRARRRERHAADRARLRRRLVAITEARHRARPPGLPLGLDDDHHQDHEQVAS
jgi:predicted transcriptional regulator